MEIAEKELLEMFDITYYTLQKWLSRGEFAKITYYFKDYSKHANKVYKGFTKKRLEKLKKFVLIGMRNKKYAAKCNGK